MIDYKKSVVPLDHITTDTKVYQLKDKKGRKDTQALREETHAEFGNYTSYILIEDATVDKIGKYAKTSKTILYFFISGIILNVPVHCGQIPR